MGVKHIILGVTGATGAIYFLRTLRALLANGHRVDLIISKFGMVTLDAFLIEKYLAGMIAREEVINKSQDPTTIMAKLQELELAQAVSSKGGKKK